MVREQHPSRLPVLVAGLPQLTGDLVGALLERIPLAEVHRDTKGGETLAATVDRLGIRVLIVGTAHAAAAHAVVHSRPVLKVLVITAEGSDGEVHEFVPVRRWLGAVSEHTLERALRDAAVPWPPVWESL